MTGGKRWYWGKFWGVCTVIVVFLFAYFFSILESHGTQEKNQQDAKMKYKIKKVIFTQKCLIQRIFVGIISL